MSTSLPVREGADQFGVSLRHVDGTANPFWNGLGCRGSHEEPHPSYLVLQEFLCQEHQSLQPLAGVSVVSISQWANSSNLELRKVALDVIVRMTTRSRATRSVVQGLNPLLPKKGKRKILQRMWRWARVFGMPWSWPSVYNTLHVLRVYWQAFFLAPVDNACHELFGKPKQWH